MFDWQWQMDGRVAVQTEKSPGCQNSDKWRKSMQTDHEATNYRVRHKK